MASSPVSDCRRSVNSRRGEARVKELVENEDRLDREAIGTGPFIQAEWTPKERSVFEKHPDYFKEGLPFVDKVITVVQNDTGTLRAGFLTDSFFTWTAGDDDDARDMVSAKDTMVGWKSPTASCGWRSSMRTSVADGNCGPRRWRSLWGHKTRSDPGFRFGIGSCRPTAITSPHSTAPR